MKDGAIVKFSNVSKIYSRNHLFSVKKINALINFSFELKKGEIVGILGLNGAGKTTIMKLLCGLIFPSSGRIEINGKNPLLPEAKRELGYLPELPYFHPNLTAFQTLKYYAKLSGKKASENDLDAMISRVGLSPHESKRVSEYSKGMKQRLGLAQALIHKPELVIMDEPVSGLDPLAIRAIRNLISEINKEGTTIFLSSHSISELEKISDRVIIISFGKIISVVQRETWENAKEGLEGIFVEAVK